MRPDDLLGRTALGLAGGCIALVAVTVGALAMPAVRSRLGLARVQAPSYAIGGRIDVPAQVYETSRYTVVMFARSDCGACQRAKPLFTKLAADEAGRPDVHVVLVTGVVNRTGEVAYARELGLDETHVVACDLTTLRLRQVPTLLVVDQQGIVRQSWEGSSFSAQEEILHSVTSFLHTH